MVAMELAASLRPFRKSNASAMTMSPPSSSISSSSHMFDDDAADAVGDVFESVHHLFEVIVDFDADDVVHRIAVAMFLKQVLDAVVGERVRVGLETDDLLGDRIQPVRVVAQVVED